MNITILIIGIIIIILVILILTNKPEKLEHLTFQSEEALQNLASLYNKDAMTIGKITALNQMNVGKTGIVMNKSTGKVDLYIDGDIHVNGNIYMNPDMDGNPKTSGSSAIIFGSLGMREYGGHLSMINAVGSAGMPKGGVLFLARNDGGIWSPGSSDLSIPKIMNIISRDWNTQAGGDAANFGTFQQSPI